MSEGLKVKIGRRITTNEFLRIEVRERKRKEDGRFLKSKNQDLVRGRTLVMRRILVEGLGC